MLRNCLFGASVQGGTQARFTLIGKVVFVGLGTLPALFTCFIDMSLRFFICWLHHQQKHEKYEDSGFAGAGPLFRFIFYECFQRLLQFLHFFSAVPLPSWSEMDIEKASRIPFRLYSKKLHFRSLRAGGYTSQVYPHWRSRIFRAGNIACTFNVFY